MKKKERIVKTTFFATDVFKLILYVSLGIIAILLVFCLIKGISSIITWFSQHIFVTILLSPILIGVFIGIIRGLCSGNSDDSYFYSDHNYTESEYKYDNQDVFGVSHGSTSVNGNKSTHNDIFGISNGYSETDGDKIQHRTWYGGYNGVSKINGNKIDHYGDIDEGYVYKGHSEIRDNGDIDHYDSWGVYTGTSKKK